MLKKIISILKFLLESPKDRDIKEFLRKVMNYISASNLRGDYAEFGVFKGGTFIKAIKMAQAKKLEWMRFYAFDSFEGLPETSGTDAEKFKKGEYKSSLEVFKENLRNNKVEHLVRISKGWFKDTLREPLPAESQINGSVIIAWIDVDLYESTKDVLDFLTPRLVDGSVIIFDDWFQFKGNPNKGERKAFTEWLAKNPQFIATEFQKYSWKGTSWIISEND